MRHLDRCQLINSDGTDSLIFFDKFIFKLDDAPDTAAEQPIIFGSVFRLNWNVFDSEVGKLSLIAVFLDVQLDRQLINNRVAAALTQNGQDLLRLVRADEIVRQNLFDIVNALVNHALIVRAAVLSQEELQNIDRNIRTLFD